MRGRSSAALTALRKRVNRAAGSAFGDRNKAQDLETAVARLVAELSLELPLDRLNALPLETPVVGKVTVAMLDAALSKLCPLWPFC